MQYWAELAGGKNLPYYYFQLLELQNSIFLVSSLHSAMTLTLNNAPSKKIMITSSN